MEEAARSVDSTNSSNINQSQANEKIHLHQYTVEVWSSQDYREQKGFHPTATLILIILFGRKRTYLRFMFLSLPWHIQFLEICIQLHLAWYDNKESRTSEALVTNHFRRYTTLHTLGKSSYPPFTTPIRQSQKCQNGSTAPSWVSKNGDVT